MPRRQECSDVRHDVRLDGPGVRHDVQYGVGHRCPTTNQSLRKRLLRLRWWPARGSPSGLAPGSPWSHIGLGQGLLALEAAPG
jgi:hypothetical protein